MKLVATCFGIGYMQKGAGSVAALFCCLLWAALRVDLWNVWWQACMAVALLVAGAVAASAVEGEWGHDSQRVVVDEWMGMAITLIAVPFSWLSYAVAFALFRAFDIAKPLGIRRAERLPGGWGVMADDLLAGAYSAVLLQGLLKTHLL